MLKRRGRETKICERKAGTPGGLREEEEISMTLAEHCYHEMSVSPIKYCFEGCVGREG